MKQTLKKCIAMMMAFTLVSQSIVHVQAYEQENVDLKLWYNSPAQNSYQGWENWSLPLGNGSIGASVFGGTDIERIQLNEKTLWNGGPKQGQEHSYGNLKDKGQYGKVMQQIKEKFLSGDNEGAQKLCDQLVGVESAQGNNGYGYYLSFGNLYLDLGHRNVSQYYRDLNLDNAIASVKYHFNNTLYTRENFVSYEDNVLVTQLVAEGNGDLDMTVRVDPDNTPGGNNWTNKGYKRSVNKKVNNHVITTYGQIEDNDLKYVSQTKVVADGQVMDQQDSIRVENAKKVTIYTSLGTDYQNDYPYYRSGESMQDVKNRLMRYINKASLKSYKQLKQEHIKDYQSIYHRVKLDLGQTQPNQTTNTLFDSYNNHTLTSSLKRYMEVLLYQYGRYLAIASSREAPQNDPTRVSLPSNLQGIWTGGNNSEWHADYHLNVNLQMNYWPTYSANMSETGKPLIDYVDSLREPGRETAYIYAGIKSEKGEENGFMAHTQNTPFGWTGPGWQFNWGWSPAGVPWILQNVYEYYEFSGDKDYLLKKIYPMMKEAAKLYDAMLVRHPRDGKLYVAPAYSPEHGPRTLGNTYEHSLVWQLYEDTITAAKTLGIDQDLVKKWEQNQKDLRGPIEIGTDGQIKEWYHETTLNSVPSEGYNHRHLSHMLGLFPGDLISVDQKELFNAAKISMKNRTDSSTGWGMGQRINTWARLRDGDKAYKLIGDLFKDGLLYNLWDRHGQDAFQIDGNFGYTSGVTEMLLQSNHGYIDLLPALPQDWADGQVSGLKARGNVEVGMKWQDAKLQEVTLKSLLGGELVVNAPEIASAIIKDSHGRQVTYETLSSDRIAFKGLKGEIYTISQFDYQEAAPQAHAYRLDDQKVELVWEHTDNMSYDLYKSVGDGDLVLVASDIQGESWVDKQASTLLKDVHYYIRGTREGKVTQLSQGIKIVDDRTMPGKIDNIDERIEYVGNWNNWDSKTDGNYNNTIQYTAHQTSNETAKLHFSGTGIAVVVCKNKDYGHLDITVDQQESVRVDLNSPDTKRQFEIYKVENLKPGHHTIELKTVDKKVELDYFEVFNKNIESQPITLETVNGQTTVGKKHTTLQLQSSLPFNRMTLTSSNDQIATVSQDGLVTFKEQNGTVTITATSLIDAHQQASIQLTLDMPVDSHHIVEDGIKGEGNVGIKNKDITYSPQEAWSTWCGEGAVGLCHGDTKTEIGHNVSLNDQYYIEYTFKGTGIAVFAEKHFDHGSFKILIDGKEKETVSLGQAKGDGSCQQKIYTIQNLSNGEHTIKLIPVAREGKTKVNIDYFEVYQSVGKAQLQDLLDQSPYINNGQYEQTKWNNYYPLYQHGVDIMNKENASIQEIDNAINQLTEALKALGQPSQKPLVSNQKVHILHVEPTKAYLSWDAVPQATSYIIEYNGQKQTIQTNQVVLKDLQAGSDYQVSVKAVNEHGMIALPSVTFTTPQSVVLSLDVVKNIHHNQNNHTITIHWDSVKDATQYRISIDGVIIETKTNSYTFDMKYNHEYRITIQAMNNHITSPMSYYTFTTNPLMHFDIVLNYKDLVVGQKVPFDVKLNSHSIINQCKIDMDQSIIKVNQGMIEALDSGFVTLTVTYQGHSQTVQLSIKANQLALIDTLKQAQSLNKKEYTKDSWFVLQTALDEAYKVSQQEYVKQQVVNNAQKTLQAAIEGLVKVSIETHKVDKHALALLIQEANRIDLSNMSTSSIHKFKEALEYANNVLANQEVTQDEVDKAYQALLTAKNQLVVLDHHQPHTGDTLPLLTMFVIFGISMFGVMILRKER